MTRRHQPLSVMHEILSLVTWFSCAQNSPYPTHGSHSPLDRDMCTLLFVRCRMHPFWSSAHRVTYALIVLLVLTLVTLSCTDSLHSKYWTECPHSVAQNSYRKNPPKSGTFSEIFITNYFYLKVCSAPCLTKKAAGPPIVGYLQLLSQYICNYLP
jgi:hypothetical protein